MRPSAGISNVSGGAGRHNQRDTSQDFGNDGVSVLLSEVNEIGYTGESAGVSHCILFSSRYKSHRSFTMNSVHKHSDITLITNTNNIVWEVGDGRTLTICVQFNPNPETGSSIASVTAFQSDRASIPVQDGILIRVDYDLRSDRFTRFRSSGCACLREQLERILSQQRERLADWLQKARAKANDDLRRRVFDSDLCDGGKVGYHELIPGSSNDCMNPTFTAGTIMIRNAERWWISDMYCASPECNCDDALFVFYLVTGTPSTTQDIVCVDYKSHKSYHIREVDKKRITMEAAHDLVKDWFDQKPVWFTDDEIKSRSRQLKQVMARTIQQRERLGVAIDGHSMKAGRNDPCPCGSGRKFKKCCGGR